MQSNFFGHGKSFRQIKIIHFLILRRTAYFAPFPIHFVPRTDSDSVGKILQNFFQRCLTTESPLSNEIWSKHAYKFTSTLTICVFPNCIFLSLPFTFGLFYVNQTQSEKVAQAHFRLRETLFYFDSWSRIHFSMSCDGGAARPVVFLIMILNLY